MNDLRSEEDLLAALADLGKNAPAAADVLPSASGLARRARRPGRWLAPLATAVVVALVATVLVLTRERSSAPPAGGDPQQLVGVSWQVQSVNGQNAARRLFLMIEPNGRFGLGTGYCASLQGHMTLTSARLIIDRVRSTFGLCPGLPPAASPRERADAKALHTMFTGTISWELTGGRLILRKPGNPAIAYTRSPSSPQHTRQWTYHSVGITVPASWPKNALRCGTPIRNTVVYPGPVDSCGLTQPPAVTSVTFSTYQRGQAPRVSLPVPPPSTILIDGVRVLDRHGVPRSGLDHGLSVVEYDIPSRHVTVLIASPSNGIAINLSDRVYLTGK